MIDVKALIADDKLSKHARDNNYIREQKPQEKANRRSLRDPIKFLVDHNHINTDHERAARNISIANLQIVGGVDIKTASLEGRVDGSRGNNQVEEAQRTIDLHKAYSLWWEKTTAKKRSITLDIVNHGVNLAGIKRKHGVDHRTSKKWLKECLNLFMKCQMEISR